MSKTITVEQQAKLALLKMTLGSTIPRNMFGYLDMFDGNRQPVAVASQWLAQLEKVAPGITEKYWKIVNP